MPSELSTLTALIRELQRPLTLEQMLQLITERSSALLGSVRVGLRLLDATGSRLLATCRVGEPLTFNPFAEFKIGEGLVGWIAKHGQALRTGNAEADPRFVVREDQREAFASFLGVPLMSGDKCMGVLSAVSLERDAFSERDEELLTLLAAICAPQVEISRLERLASVDPLTGVLNRRGLDLAFPSADARPASAEPDPRPDVLSVIMADVDHFKRINDEHGHAAGDEVLRRVAQLLASVLRVGDAVVRYGGEEFLLILPGVDRVRAERIAERARASVAEHPVMASGRPVSVTASLGVAERRPGEDRDALIRRADEAMYRAKQAGRNRVEVD